MRLSSLKFIATSLAATALFGAVSLGAAQQAIASSTVYVNGNTTATGTDVLALTYNSGGAGASAYFYGDIADYAGTGVYSAGSGTTTIIYIFEDGAGSGQAVKNNAAWADNGSVTDSYTIYYNSNYEGASQVYAPEYYGTNSGNLDTTLHNNEASQYERYAI